MSLESQLVKLKRKGYKLVSIVEIDELELIPELKAQGYSYGSFHRILRDNENLDIGIRWYHQNQNMMVFKYPEAFLTLKLSLTKMNIKETYDL